MSANEKHGCHGGDGSTLPTQPAPLLRAEMLDDVDGLSQLLDPCEESNGELQRALQALADGRTVNVRVLTEDECRAEFEAWYFLHAWKLPTPAEIWLACARAMGAVR